MLRLIAKVLTTIALMAFIAGASLFVLSTYAATWPLFRLSPRARRAQALAEMGTAAVAVIRAFTPDSPPAE